MTAAISLLAQAPALPLHTAGKYVAGAYVALLVMLVVYVGIMALRLTRMQRTVGDLLARAQEDAGGGEPERESRAA